MVLPVASLISTAFKVNGSAEVAIVVGRVVVVVVVVVIKVIGLREAATFLGLVEVNKLVVVGNTTLIGRVLSMAVRASSVMAGSVVAGG